MYRIEIDGHHIELSRTAEGAFVDAMPPCPQVVEAMVKALRTTSAGRTILKEAEWIGGQMMWTGVRIPGVVGTIVIHEGHRGVEPKALAKTARRWADVLIRLSMGMRPQEGTSST